MTLHRRSSDEDGLPTFIPMTPEEEAALRSDPATLIGNDSGIDYVIEGQEAADFLAVQTAVADAQAALPLSVPATSAKLVLDDDGLYANVEGVCMNHPVLAVRIFWTTSNTWHEAHPYVQAIAAELHLTAAQIHDMFQRALLK
jgi:hypothetical protein